MIKLTHYVDLYDDWMIKRVQGLSEAISQRWDISPYWISAQLWIANSLAGIGMFASVYSLFEDTFVRALSVAMAIAILAVNARYYMSFMKMDEQWKNGDVPESTAMLYQIALRFNRLYFSVFTFSSLILDGVVDLLLTQSINLHDVVFFFFCLTSAAASYFGSTLPPARRRQREDVFHRDLIPIPTS